MDAVEEKPLRERVSNLEGKVDVILGANVVIIILQILMNA